MGDFLELLKKNVGVIEPEDVPEEKIGPPKKWANRWKWRHPTAHFPRPDGLAPIPPGGEFFTRGRYPSEDIAKERADNQLYGFKGPVWPMHVRPFLEYKGAHKMEDE